MNNILIPEELETFLSAHEGSLLIKGLPGTGKTILALSILKTLGGNHGFYVTTRIKPQNLVYDYPWIKDAIPVDHIIDASKSIFTKAVVKEVEGKDFGFIKYSDRPSFISELYQLLRGSESPLIVLDSIEGIQEATVERIYVDLLDVQRELGIRMIFVSEYEENKELDYLVDGVVLLRREFLEGEILRMLQINKLRGVHCKRCLYIFTLNCGVFKYFEPFRFHPPKEEKMFEPLPDSETHFSSGSRDLDNILGGGYEKGSTILLEVGKNVTRDAYFYFIMLTAFNFLSKGKTTIGSTTLGVSPALVYSSFIKFLGEEKAGKAIVIKEGMIRGKPKSELAQDFLQTYEETISKVEMEGGGIAWGLDSLLNKYGNHLIPILEQAKFDTQNKRLLTIWTIKHGANGIDKIASMVDYHFKIEEKGGVFLFHSQKPRTGLYAIEIDASHGCPEIKLVPIT
ncbi:MAG: ATPase domain-containing protein [Candidatus Jordarchaeaceae archaeon]